MNTTNHLVNAYREYLSVPWRDGLPSEQRIICMVYRESMDSEVAAGMMEFENATREAGLDWAIFELQGTFERWMATHRYAEKYFEKPHLLPIPATEYLEFIVDGFKEFLHQTALKGKTWSKSDTGKPANRVVALTGMWCLFGFLDIFDVLLRLVPMVQGRLLVFFPGSYENCNYRFLDSIDSRNYRAVPISGEDSKNQYLRKQIHS